MTTTKQTLALVLVLLSCTALAAARDADAPASPPPPPPEATQVEQAAPQTPAAAPDNRQLFGSATGSIHKQLEESLAELSALRQEIADQNIPLNRKLSELEAELIQARREFQDAQRVVDTRTIDLTGLRNQIKARQEETAYLLALMGEYIRAFETRLHITELHRYRDLIEAAKLAPENENLSEYQVFEAQAGVLAASLDRLHEIAGGARFEGSAVNPDGMVKHGTFLLVGPAALFQSADGLDVGTAEQRLGSLEPTIIPFHDPADAQAAAAVVAGAGRAFPLDATLGTAHKVQSIEETFLEHVKKGGPVMVPIFVLAGAALLVALYKWVTLMLVRQPSRREVHALLAATARRDQQAAIRAARALRGPTGKMLLAGVEHLNQPRELIEEVMYETVLETRLRLHRWLPFVAICAAAAPLLGLLGTVTGIMNTFRLITVFGTGDVNMLSSGISEALITTEYGLIVAIPSLLLHAFFSRKARSLVDKMEQSAMAFLNQVSKVPPAPPEPKPETKATLAKEPVAAEPPPMEKAA